MIMQTKNTPRHARLSPEHVTTLVATGHAVGVYPRKRVICLDGYKYYYDVSPATIRAAQRENARKRGE